MDQTRQDIFAKLEAAIERWSTELAEAQSGLATEVARAKNLFQGREESSGETRTPGTSTLTQASLDALVEFFRENCEALRETVGNLSRWDDAAKRFHEDLDALGAVVNRSPEHDQGLSEKLESLRTRMEEVRECVTSIPRPPESVDTFIGSMRDQLGRLQESLALSQQPAQRMLEDLGALRAEMAELRQRPSVETESDRRLEGHIQNLSAELGLIREIVAGTPELDHGVTDELRSLRAEVRQIRDEVAHVAALRDRLDSMARNLRNDLVQLETRLIERPSSGPAEGPSSETFEPAAVELSADADLSADIEAFGHVPDEQEGAGEPYGLERPAEPAKPYVPPFQAYGPDGSRRRLGEILLAASVISQSQLDRALAAQESSPQKHLGSLLIEMGLTGEDVIAQTLACQLGLPYVKLDPESLDPEAVRLIRSRVALRHKCIPVQVKDGHLVLAIANPLDLIALEDVERAAQLPVEPVVASSADIAAAIEWCYRSPGAEI